MKKHISSLFAALLLCAALALPSFAATYPAGMDESLPRVVDGAGLLTQAEIESLEARAREIITQYGMDLVILTRRGLGGKTPEAYADDFFDYEGYGWWEEESDDFNAASGALLLVNMVGPGNNDLLISTTGAGESVFRDGVWEQLITDMLPQLRDGDFAGAFGRFLTGAQRCLRDYADGVGVYADPDAPYNQGHYNEEGSYVYEEGYGYDGEYGNGGSGYSGGIYFDFDGTIFFIVAVIGLIIAWAVTASMKKKHNTIRTAAAACNYQQNFNLTERQDIFLYSNTTRVRIPEPTSSSGGGGGFSGGGSHTSSSGRSHGGGGTKF